MSFDKKSLLTILVFVCLILSVFATEEVAATVQEVVDEQSVKEIVPDEV